MIVTKEIGTVYMDDGTEGLTLQAEGPLNGPSMSRIACGTHQVLVAIVPVDDVTFAANLAAVKLRGGDGPLATQMRVAGLDDALADLAAREG